MLSAHADDILESRLSSIVRIGDKELLPPPVLFILDLIDPSPAIILFSTSRLGDAYIISMSVTSDS